MAVSMAVFTMNDSITKAVSSQMNFGQMMLVRGLVAIVLIAAFAWYQDALRPLRTLLIRPVGLRVIGEIGGTLTFLSAIAHMPLANASAIFQALPLVITLGAALVFGEPVGWRRWLGDRGRLRRRARHRSSGHRGVQRGLRCWRSSRLPSALCAISRHARSRPKSLRCSLRS